MLIFFCPELKLAIEIDGDTHVEQEEYDFKRSKNLNNFGIKIIRYKNSEVLNNLEGVEIDLMQKLEQRVGEVKV